MEFDRPGQVFLKTVVNGKIIGSMRGYAENETAWLSRMAVHPYFRKRGIGRKLIQELEQVFPDVERFEVKVGHKSEQNLVRFKTQGYREFKTEPFKPGIDWIHLQKDRT